MHGIIAAAGLGTAAMMACGVAVAQTSTNSPPNGTSDPSQMSCSQLATMDQNAAPFLIYYVAGFNRGQVQALQNGGVSASTGLQAGQANTAPAATGGAAASQGADKVNTGQPGGSSGQQSNAASGGQGGSGQPSGLPALDVAAIQQACAASPQSMITDIISTKSGAQ